MILWDDMNKVGYTFLWHLHIVVVIETSHTILDHGIIIELRPTHKSLSMTDDLAETTRSELLAVWIVVKTTGDWMNKDPNVENSVLRFRFTSNFDDHNTMTLWSCDNDATIPRSVMHFLYRGAHWPMEKYRYPRWHLETGADWGYVNMRSTNTFDVIGVLKS